MRGVLPGKPEAKLQAVCTAQWSGVRIVAYISGNALNILGGPHDLLQTIYHEDLKPLEAVAIDLTTGKIATCSEGNIYVYRPCGRTEGLLKWSLQCSFVTEEGSGKSCTLSWGASEELLVGSSALRLYQTTKGEALIWSRLLSSPAKLAVFSYDASLIASTATYDCLVKIWRRLSYGSDDVRFDFSYLPHPSIVTGMHWRRPPDSEQNAMCVLYTICADNRVRIWAATDPHGSQVLQLWADINVQESIQPRYLTPSDASNERYVFIIDGQDFASAMDRVRQTILGVDNNGNHDLALEHLDEVVKRKPEVCVVLDNKGHMSAWGLENIGGKKRNPNDIFNFAHVENLNIQFPATTSEDNSFAQILGFYDSGPAYTLLVHHFDGRIVWLETAINKFFDPTPGRTRIYAKGLWTGHDGPIRKMVRSISGGALISRTSDNDGLIWLQKRTAEGVEIFRHSSLTSPEHIHRTSIFDNGAFVVTLHHHGITFWDAQHPISEVSSYSTFELDGKPLCLLQLPAPSRFSQLRYLATISSTLKGIVWEVQLPQPLKLTGVTVKPSSAILREYCRFDLGQEDDLAFALPVDPAGSTLAAGFFDTFASDIAISYTHSGVLRTWTAKVDIEEISVEWLATSTISTGIENPSLASGSSIRKIAVVNAVRNGLTIWDTRSGQLEYDEHLAADEVIGDLDWSSTPDDQSILAVGYPHKVIILAQMRFDYLDKGPAWAPIREIHIGELTTYPIGDSTWLENGNLIIGAGHQLFICDKNIATSDDMISEMSIPIHKHPFVDLFDVVALLNGPLPVFHPQFLGQSILAGKFSQVQKVIINLNRSLKFFSEGDNLDSYLMLRPDHFLLEQDDLSLSRRKRTQSSFSDFSSVEESDIVTEELAMELNDNLSRIAVPYISSQEQIHLVDIIECVALGEKNWQSIDNHALRYILFFRQQMLRQRQASQARVGITWREFIWAVHSESQDVLVNLVSQHFNGRMLWEHAKESGMFMWMTDITALRVQFEVIARNEYTKTDEKNPTDCSLYYLALKKKNVLLSLWRMAAWNREQSSTQKLLSNNFADPRWKTAALKNAYALLGKRRFEYAAAFFLLAGNLRDAVNICAHQLHDIQLAIAVARVYEGDDGPILRGFLEEKVLPLAAFEGNRWLATWAFRMLGKRDMAIKALISPIHSLIPTTNPPSRDSKSYLASDPALIVLYKYLRDKSLQTPKAAVQLEPKEEWDFVMRTARLYGRMGCDLLALDLVRNWTFVHQPKKLSKEVEAEQPNSRQMKRQQSSLLVDQMQTSSGPSSEKTGRAANKTAPKVFEEPSANSLLDSFGF